MKTLLAGVILTGCVNASGSVVSHSSKRMADGKQWSTTNLNVNVAPPIDIKMTNRTGVSGTNGSEWLCLKSLTSTASKEVKRAGGV
jgi:hypothetical protein